jgi:hypothetical protein
LDGETGAGYVEGVGHDDGGYACHCTCKKSQGSRQLCLPHRHQKLPINIILINTPHFLGVSGGKTYSFVSCVGGKLTCTIGNNPYTIRAISTHKPSPPFLPPHFPQRTPYTGIIRRPRSLNLEQNLHSFEGRDNCSGDCTCCSSCYKGCRGRRTM